MFEKKVSGTVKAIKYVWGGCKGFPATMPVTLYTIEGDNGKTYYGASLSHAGVVDLLRDCFIGVNDTVRMHLKRREKFYVRDSPQTMAQRDTEVCTVSANVIVKAQKIAKT